MNPLCERSGLPLWERVLIALPGLAGLLLLVLALGQRVANTDATQVRQLWRWEMPVAMVGFAATIALGVCLLRRLFQRRWPQAAWASLSLLAFAVGFLVAGTWGPGFLLAT